MSSTPSRIAPRTRPSMADVGRLADVSAQTVSRFFTGTGYVSAETRTRIEAAVAELGYRPNHVARAFRVNRTNTIGVLTMGTMNYGVSATYAGVTAAAHATDYSIVISHIDVDIDDPGALEEARRGLDTLQSLQVDGIILATQYRDADELLEGISEQLPVVTLSGRPLPTADTVALNSHEAGLLATRHLIELGHERILHICGPQNRNEAIERERGYTEAMKEAGLDVPAPVPGTSWGAESGHHAGLTVDPASFTAVFAANDAIALGFLSAMRSRGLESPRDFSIVGVDDMPETAFYSPPLTTMRMDFDELGVVAFDMIRRHIESGERVDLRVLPSALVVRESTAPPTR
ncbi:LacI family DNA-binding transcriptional regulator [Lysobacter korlensis]|uniref:LacI family DNA-binding transcriptional regulator n=1 Tax=Lysobacter korlensis TaxID=553636 RepID=A0ABV6RP71_9GAMM